MTMQRGAAALALILLIGAGSFAARASPSPVTGPGPVFWPEHVLDHSASGADGVNAADVDGDGDVDLVVGWEQSGKIVAYLNPGTAAQGWQQALVAQGLPFLGVEDAVFLDLDGNGVADSILAAVDAPGMRLFWLDPPSDRSSESPNGWRATGIGPAFQRLFLKVRAAAGPDGTVIVAAGSKSGYGVWQGAVDLFHFDPSKSKPLGQRVLREVGKVKWLEFADIDGDALPDLIVATSQGFGWYRNPGGPPLDGAWEYQRIDDEVQAFAFCDLDGDKQAEIIAALNRSDPRRIVRAYKWQQQRRRWQVHEIATNQGQPGAAAAFAQKAIACGDLDRDGKLEIVLGASGVGHGIFFLDPGEDAYRPWQVVPVTEYGTDMKYDDVRLVDMDGDGDLDIVSTEETQGIFTPGRGVVWYENVIAAPSLPGASAFLNPLGRPSSWPGSDGARP